MTAAARHDSFAAMDPINDNRPLFTERDAVIAGDGEVTILCHGDLWAAWIGSPLWRPELLRELWYLAPKFETRAHAVDWAVRNPDWLDDTMDDAAQMSWDRKTDGWAV